MNTTPEFPACIADLMAGCRVDQRRRGRLGTTIFRVITPTGAPFYLKAASLSSLEDLEREKECLLWLRDRICVPRVIAFAEHEGWSFLALSEAAGQTACESSPATLQLPDTIALLGRALRRIHTVDAVDWPFRDTLGDELRRAGEMLEKGWLDQAAFQAANGGRGPEEVYAELLATRDFDEELTFTHGDYAMPNVMVENGQVTSILDWANARVGDPHRDFVVMGESLARNCGGDWMPAFLAEYGGKSPEPRRLRFYSLLDQFFTHFSSSALSPEWPAPLGRTR